MLIESINNKMILLEFYLLRRVIEFLSLYELQCLSFCDENVASLLKQFNIDHMIEDATDKGDVVFGSEEFLSPSRILTRAIQDNKLPLARRALRRGAKNCQDEIYYAAYKGHQQMVNLLLSHGADNYDQVMMDAAYGGRQEIVNQMLSLGAKDYNKAMICAAHRGHQHIVNQMLNLGANDYNGAMGNAACGGHQHIINQMLNLGANDYDRAMGNAAHQQIVDQMRVLINHEK